MRVLYIYKLREIITHYDPHTPADLEYGGGGAARTFFPSPSDKGGFRGVGADTLLSGIRPPADRKGPPFDTF